MLPFFVDERPLRGAAGLCDWRLCGRLSRLLQSARVAGKWGETTLYPPGKRLPFARLVLFGLGAGGSLRREGGARGVARWIADKMLQAGHAPVRARAAGALDGAAVGAPRARDLPRGGRAGVGARAADVVVVESVAGQKEAADLAASRALNQYLGSDEVAESVTIMRDV